MFGVVRFELMDDNLFWINIIVKISFIKIFYLRLAKYEQFSQKDIQKKSYFLEKNRIHGMFLFFSVHFGFNNQFIGSMRIWLIFQYSTF